MAGEVRRQEQSYRRGLVMGLTMAEVMVLVVFCLLLLLGGALKTAERDEGIAALLERGPAILEAAGLSADEPIPDDFLELVKAGKTVRELLAADGREVSTRELERVVRLAEEARQALGHNAMSEDSTDAAAVFINQASKAYEDARQVRPHGSASLWLESTLKAAASCEGNGLDYPPCARTPDGRPAMVFTATLTSGAVTIHDNRVPGLETAREAWPVSSIRFNEPLSIEEFLVQTRPMYDWSAARACRFFVLVVDKTGPAEKSIYKRNLRTVEQHFYKYEPLGSQTN